MSRRSECLDAALLQPPDQRPDQALLRPELQECESATVTGALRNVLERGRADPFFRHDFDHGVEQPALRFIATVGL